MKAEFMAIENGKPKGLLQTSYKIDNKSISGVVSVMMGMKAALDNDYNMRLVGPYMRDESRNGADYTLGRMVKGWTKIVAGVTRGNTQLEPGISFNKALAKNLILTTRPDFVILEEPLSTHAAHTLISGMPKGDRDEDGNLRRKPTVIGHFHAQKEKVGIRLKLLKTLFTLIRRPAFGEDAVNKFGIKLPWTQGYINTVLNSLDGKAAVSKSTADGWMKQFPQIGEMEVIYNPVDTESFTPYGPKIESWNDGRTTILFSGRHEPRKGIVYLIRAYDLLRKIGINDTKLKIAGDGIMTGELKALVRELGTPDVEFLGKLPKYDPTAKVDLVRAKRSADIFASTAIGSEGFGLDPAEAAASGTLTIASDINGYREVFGGKPYARTPGPRSIYDIAKSILELKNMSEETKLKLRHMAREDIDSRFNKELTRKKWVNYIDECMDLRGRPAKDSWPNKERRKKRKLFPVRGEIFRRSSR